MESVMGRWMSMLLVLGAAAGCTSAQLRRNTIWQVSTITDVQHQVVLNNLAAFSCSPYAIPAQATLRNGATQVIDSGSATAEYIAGVAGLLGLTRTAVDQWITSPITDETTLRLLRIAYRRAFGSQEDLYTDDFANRLAHRLKMQITTLPDMALENAHMYARGPALPQLLDRPGWKGDSNLGFIGDDPTVQLWKKDTGDIISTSSDRIIQKGEILAHETLTVTPVLVDGMPVVWPGEKTPRVLVATPYATEIRRQIYALNSYLTEINAGWFVTGCKRDVPKCACYVGSYKNCDCVSYVWVRPENRQDFEEFTLKIIRLCTLIQDQNSGAFLGGVIYSPPVSR